MPTVSFDTPAGDRRMRRGAWVALALLVLGCAVYGLPIFDGVRARLQQRDMRIGDDEVTKLHYLLLEGGLLAAAPAGPSPSTLAVPAELLREKLPTISIVTDADGLYSAETGIFTNYQQKGRKWERKASISYFEEGKLRYQTPAGLRIHGGSSREHPIKNFQLVFRRSYSGQPRSEAGVFFGSDGPAVQRVVLNQSVLPKRFLNNLALEIAGELGCLTSRHQPVRVLLNGELIPSGYTILEHQSREFLRAHFGHDDFEWIRLKGNSPRSESLSEFADWLNRRRKEVTIATVSQRYDLEDLIAWILAVSFCDTRDVNQGGYFKDRVNPAATWRGVAWDMDASFHNGEPSPKQKYDFGRIGGIRGRIFHRLCENDPEFRALFRQRAEAALAGPLSEVRIRQLVAKYRAVATSGIFPVGGAHLLPALENTETFLLERRKKYLFGLERYYYLLKDGRRKDTDDADEILEAEMEQA